MKTLTIIKQDYQGLETYRYPGRLIDNLENEIKIEAYFDRDDALVDKIILNRGDRFLESYFDKRWYNIFEIHDRNDDHIKCWYCNVCMPAVFDEHFITYRDLALDLLVYPDGSQVVLDEDEFAALPLPSKVNNAAQVNKAALEALLELQGIFK
jgi:predicted RNA-binding protein associated with RNAse of E/G family